MNTRRIGWILVILALVMGASAASAQVGGQFCARAFDDRNGNGLREAGEPPLTRAVSVNLLDASNVTIASALLETSPTAAQGVVCFTGLTAGQYTLSVTSADFTATTPTSMTTTIDDGGLPTVMEFGGRLAAASETTAPAPTASGLTDREQLARLVIAALGALVVVAGMVVLGVIVYWVAFRGRQQPVPAAMDPRRTTGSMSAVRTRDTSEVPRVE